MHARNLEVKSTTDREIVMTRVFNAPRERVFQAWTDPKHVDNWWGPRGFQTRTSEMDVRPGGVWRYDMLSQEFGDFPNKIVYEEVVRPERLVYAHGTTDEAPPEFHVTVTFAERGHQTELTMRMVFPTAEARDKVIKEVGAIEGGNQTLDRLAEWLAKA